MEGDHQTEKLEDTKKKGRRRKRLLYTTVCKQMEFYFSDANLTKDRFLGQLIEVNPYVPLETFLQFNKVKSLVSTAKDIANAIKDSQILKLSKDGSKVRRKTPFNSRDNEDDCTIYVENLLPETTHEEVTKVFSEFGKVVYVSIPKYRNTQAIKGFGFVEFNTPEEAAKTLEVFSEKGSCLSSQMLPEKLCSIQTFEDPNSDHHSKSVKVKNEESGASNRETQSMNEISMNCSAEVEQEIEDSVDPSSRQAKEDPDCSKDTELKSKKRKHSSSETNIDSTSNTSSKEKKMKTSEAENKEEAESSEKEGSESEGPEEEDADEAKENSNAEGKKKKNRKKKKKPKEERDLFANGIHVLSKKEWKRLRNKYLNMQHANMKKVKQQVWEARFLRRNWNNQYHQAHAPKDTGGGADEEIQTSTGPESSKPRVSFTPGVIVQVSFNEPVVDVKNFKGDAKSHQCVQYVDIREGAFEAYLRCASAQEASQLLQNRPWDQMCLVQGEEENSYWDKIFKDREEKLSKKTRVKERGRKKLIRKAEAIQSNHLYFDS